MIPELVQVKIQEQDGQKSLKNEDQHSVYENLQGNSHFIAKTGQWKYEQKLRYFLFIQYNAAHLDYRQKGQEMRLFRNMSGFIKSRRSHQCRYHHNKMHSYFGTIPSVIAYYRQNIPNHQLGRQKYIKDLEKYSLRPKKQFLRNNSVEERPLNNEDGRQKQKLNQNIQRKLYTKRISIVLALQKDNSQIYDKTLVKTEETIKTEGIVKSNKQVHSKEDSIKKDSMQMFQGNNISQLENIFNINLQSTKSLQKHLEWLQCKQLYELWRSKIESLIQSKP